MTTDSGFAENEQVTDHWLTAARRVADDALFPNALDVDRSGRIPRSHLDLLARDGLFGVAAPADAGGAGLERFDVLADVVAALAGGCLATTFVWIQHLGPLISVATTAPPEIRATWMASLTAGDRRAGIAMAGVRPGPGRIHARSVPGGYALTGTTTWVTGWGLIDTLLVGAVDQDDVARFFLMDAPAGDGPVGMAPASLIATPTHLLAVQASNTVTLQFDDHFVAAERQASSTPYAQWAGADAFGSSLNGFLSVGLASRCARLLADLPDSRVSAARLLTDIADARRALLDAEGDRIPAARADATLLAARAATELMVHTGSRSVLTDQHAQRLYREAGFLLVFGSRPAIKEKLLAGLRSRAT